MITVRHPIARSWSQTRTSRALFASNFLSQKSLRLFGVTASIQPGWRCQKHPWTKMTVRCLANTRSGEPGRFFLCNRYRSPSANAALLTSISGAVFLDRILAIIMLRRAGSTISVMVRTVVSIFPIWQVRRLSCRIFNGCNTSRARARERSDNEQVHDCESTQPPYFIALEDAYARFSV